MDLRLKRTPVIWLVGFMGCGKSTIGARLAQQLGWTFVDLDAEIESEAGRSISDIFEAEGESVFRDLEHEALLHQIQRVRRGGARVVALGGGAFAEERNRCELDDCGVSVWLDLPVEELWERVSGSDERPLGRDREAFERRYRGRQPSYALADYRISAEGGPLEVVSRVLDLGLL